ncbi:hypothetical protein [Spirosoma liriopis]|nr:hypothetical protein [Spirosoma liriopis]
MNICRLLLALTRSTAQASGRGRALKTENKKLKIRIDDSLAIEW